MELLVSVKYLFTPLFDVSASPQRSDSRSLRLDGATESVPSVYNGGRLIVDFRSFYRSSWRTRMGADSSDSVLSIGWHRSCGHGDSSSLSKVSTIIR